MAAPHIDAQSDNLGIASSIICLLHCVSIPVLLSVATHWNTDLERILNSEWIHYAFLAVALWAVYQSTRHISTPRIRLSLWSSFVIFGVGIALTEGFPIAKGLVYLGSLGLVISHVLNLRYRKVNAPTVSKPAIPH